MGRRLVSDRRLFCNADMTLLVSEDSPEACFLVAARMGKIIPLEMADALRLVMDGARVVQAMDVAVVKPMVPVEDKQIKPMVVKRKPGRPKKNG